MNKNIILTTTAVVILVLVIFTFTDDEEIVKQNHTETSISKSSQIENNTNNSAIDYDTRHNTPKIVKVIKKGKPKREKFLETWVKDSSGKFELALYNPNQDLSKNDGRYRNIQGKIDGHSFNLPVPLHIVKEGSGDVKLRIRNLETNESTSTVAAFIDDMVNPAMHPTLIIDSSDPENYQQIVHKQISPTRPGM